MTSSNNYMDQFNDHKNLTIWKLEELVGHIHILLTKYIYWTLYLHTALKLKQISQKNERNLHMTIKVADLQYISSEGHHHHC
jgi:hypothetical protein